MDENNHNQINGLEKTERKKQIFFPNHISPEEVKIGLSEGKLLEGILRINQKFPDKAYFENKDLTKSIYVINSVLKRNRALDGDEVIVRINQNFNSKSKDIDVEVVHILKKVHSRLAVGYLKPLPNDSNFALFTPRDNRLPKLHIYRNQWPKVFATEPKQFMNILFVAKISKWRKINKILGVIVVILGPSGNLKVENSAISQEFGLDTSLADDFTESLKTKYSLYKKMFPREDYRKKCVFTIDNPDSIDIDDALSCWELPNGNFEIGVHIADVSHYLEENSPLDKKTLQKATSIYLIDSTYHMLPENFCKLCSLSPNKDKLTFSVLFEMTPEGIIVDKKFRKTMINSCCQLSYQQAQTLIDYPNEAICKNNFFTIYNGFTVQDLAKYLNILQNIARKLRDTRKSNCGLQEFTSSVSFKLDSTGEPIDVIVEERLFAQDLVEEFMLLVNFNVAACIYQNVPNLALLRVNHCPQEKKLIKLQEKLQSIGIHIDISAMNKIQDSINKYKTNDHFGNVYNTVLTKLFSKYMGNNEKYVCSGTALKDTSLRHFSLGFDVYTHFTSPIRRYVDITTHRLLAAVLKYNHFKWNPTTISNIAKICNQQALNAQKASQASFDLYLLRFIENHKPYVEEAAVFNVKADCFDVITLKTKSVARVYANVFPDTWKWSSKIINYRENKGSTSIWQMIIEIPETNKSTFKTLFIEMFSVVKVELGKSPKYNKLKARLCT